MKLLIPIIFLLLSHFRHSNSAEISCNFVNGNPSDWKQSGSFYYCQINANPSITSSEATIDKISGTHKSGMDKSAVVAINTQSCADYVINYFPKGILEHFPNITIIDINCVKLKEIHQNDLKDLGRLKVLDLYNNEIEVIEKDLFFYNSELEVVWLQKNKIFEIFPGVFDKLKKLKYLYLKENVCVTSEAVNSLTEVKKLSKTLNNQCFNTDAAVMDTIKTSEETQKNLSTKMENLINYLKNLTETEKDAGSTVGEDILSIGKKVDEASKNSADLRNDLKNVEKKISQIESKILEFSTLTPKSMENVNKILRESSEKSQKIINENLESKFQTQDQKNQEKFTQLEVLIKEMKNSVVKNEKEREEKKIQDENEINCFLANEKLIFFGLFVILILIVTNVVVIILWQRLKMDDKGVVHEFEMPKFNQ